jgi:putative Holliday junction resolvase
MPGTPETILAFDFGLRRIGVAAGQQITASAGPIGTLTNSDAGPDWADIDRLVREWRPACLVVGMPFAADGSPSAMTVAVEAFVADLGRYGIPVETVDERYSSLEAQARLRQQRGEGRKGRVRKEEIDAAAAVLIAERWLKKEW